VNQLVTTVCGSLMVLGAAALFCGITPAVASEKAMTDAKSAATFGFVLALECQPEAGQAAMDKAKADARLTLQAAGLSPDDATAEAETLLASLHIQPMVGNGKAAMCVAMLKKYADGLPMLWVQLNVE
jgi:hypothetical protein